MRRFSLFATLFVLVASIAIVIVGRSWAKDLPPAARSDKDDPFGEADPRGSARSPAATPAPAPGQPSAPSSQPFDEPMPAGLRPFPLQPRVAAQQPLGVGLAQNTGVGVAGGTGGPLVRILTPEMAATHEPQTIIGAEDSPAAAKINAALQSPAEIACDKTRLSEVIEQLKKQHKIEIQLDLAALKEAGVEPDCPVTKHLSGISLKSALHLLLDDLQLMYVIHNEVLLITSPAKAESEEYMTTQLYPVKDLILVRNENDEIETDFQPLVDLIENSLASKTWIENGGVGSITPYQFQDRCLLVVVQTAAVHEEITALLAALRRCAPANAKGGNELRLPQRPKIATPGRPSIGHDGGGVF